MHRKSEDLGSRCRIKKKHTDYRHLFSSSVRRGVIKILCVGYTKGDTEGDTEGHMCVVLTILKITSFYRCENSSTLG